MDILTGVLGTTRHSPTRVSQPGRSSVLTKITEVFTLRWPFTDTIAG